MALQTYYYAQGFDQVGSLAAVSTQPDSSLILYPETLYVLGGDPLDNGTPLFKWIYSAITFEAMDALWTEFGLSMLVFAPVRTVDCTVWTAVDVDYESNPLKGFLNAKLERPNLDGKKSGRAYYNVEFIFRAIGVAS